MLETATWESAMKPLTPDDLLIRETPADDLRWGAALDAPENVVPTVSLERFQELELTLKNNPILPDPYIELARIYLRNRRWNDAKRVLERASQQFSNNDDILTLREDAQLGRSLELFNEAEAAYKAEPTVLTQEPLQSSKIELNALRERVCRARLERHPKRLELLVPLAVALENLGSVDEAIKCLRQASEIPSLRATASLQLGYLFTRARRIPDALSSFRRAALFRVPPPTDAIKREALTAAADLSQRHGLIDSARRYVELLVEMSPSDQQLVKRLADLRAMPL
jgi:tetratricopeptide (TPR) repeat protein